MSNETQLILYTSVRNFPSEAVELSASEWLDSVKASARKAHITGESRVWFTRNHPLQQRAKHRTFTWNFDKLCIAILKIEEKAKVQRIAPNRTVSSTPTTGGEPAAELGKAVIAAVEHPVGKAVSHIQKVNDLRSAGFGANGIIKGSKAAIQHSRIGMATKGSEFCAKQSLGMRNLARTTYEAVGPLSLGIAAAAVGLAGVCALYRYATEEDSVPVTEYVWDYSQITQEDLNTLARDLLEDD
ncbi:hypothetical protein C8J57DRAFT_1349296 [Mycena rebaudengoi]|nr:hypothetical protein C8J57DRAFT_1349296 [Mycena rebaudengoi]